MSDKICQIAAQYVCHAYATAFVRPYENKHPLSNTIDVAIEREALPDAGHHRVQLTVTLSGVNTDDVTCFEAGVSLEAIVVERNLTDAELDTMLTRNMPGLLLGTARVTIETISQQTGYGPVTLPPLSGDQLLALSKKGTPQ